MNVVLLVIDSLRAQSLATHGGLGPRTPFFEHLSRATIDFQRAYATECWTLPAHASIFTGLLPSAHGAHFHTMAYRHTAPTIAEVLAAAGWHTELVTRNFVFDGTIPGITRGFQKRTAVLADTGAWNPFALLLALAKPRFRRHIRTTGFFHPRHREDRTFLAAFARAMQPADGPALSYVLEQCLALRRRGRPYFMFANLYDVHAPYPPTADSILRSFRTWSGARENVLFPAVMSKLGAHRYLRPGFRVSASGRAMLQGRYDRAIELMDAKLAAFYEAARRTGILDDTMLIVTSDHGEAFGEHELFLHDASVYNTHLHVPLWIHHPDRPPERVDDVVSTRDLFGLIRAVALGDRRHGTILDPAYRREHPVAIAEHFYYPHLPDLLPRYRQNLAAAIGRTAKVIVRGETAELHDLRDDAAERQPITGPLSMFEAACRADGLAPSVVTMITEHLARRQRHSGDLAA